VIDDSADRDPGLSHLVARYIRVRKLDEIRALEEARQFGFDAVVRLHLPQEL
jgi:hypothetical protein